MRKKKKIKEHSVKADEVFNSVIVSKLVNKVMKGGEKRKAKKIVYKALETIKETMSLPPLTVLENALKNIAPSVEMSRRKFGGMVQRIPKPIDEIRSSKISLRMLVLTTREVKGFKSSWEKLVKVIKDAYNKTGEITKKKENLEKEIEASKVFSFR